MASNKFRLALIQLAVGASKADNLQRAAKLVSEAAGQGAKIISLPECCNSPYGNDYFREYAEPIPGDSTTAFSKVAKDNNIYLVAGSIPERDGDKLYNTCTVFNPEGNMVAKHRKVHLFDIDIPGKMTFQESKTLSPGNSLTTFDTSFCKVGVSICYDIRFAEMAQIYAHEGCQLLMCPAAFNMTTGPVHWQKLAQGRALDNQMYVALISPSRNESAKYVAYGHSMVVNPWGEAVAEAEHQEKIIYADIDLDFLKQVRQQIPISFQRRNDLYEVKPKGNL